MGWPHFIKIGHQNSERFACVAATPTYIIHSMFCPMTMITHSSIQSCTMSVCRLFSWLSFDFPFLVHLNFHFSSSELFDRSVFLEYKTTDNPTHGHGHAYTIHINDSFKKETERPNMQWKFCERMTRIFKWNRLVIFDNNWH